MATVSNVAELTPRQKQILQLIQSGKVNKEVARELGIEEGTVKQHIVAIFKKLKVSNRTMAIHQWQRHLTESIQVSRPPQSLVVKSQLERRPGLVLAFSMAQSIHFSNHQLLATISSIGNQYQAVFLSRKSDSCELVFGVHQLHVGQMLNALLCLNQLLISLHQTVRDLSALRVALVSGVVVASVDRFGGWTEEVIASPVIAQARSMLKDLQDGEGFVDEVITHSWWSHGVVTALFEGDRFALSSMLNLNWVCDWLDFRAENAESRLDLKNDASPAKILVVGEMGVGKSYQLSLFYQALLSQSQVVHAFRVLPVLDISHILCCKTHQLFSMTQWLDALSDFRAGEWLLVDDFHYLSETVDIESQCVARFNELALNLLFSVDSASSLNLRDWWVHRLTPWKDARIQQWLLAIEPEISLKLSSEQWHDLLSWSAGLPGVASALLLQIHTRQLPMDWLVRVASFLDRLKLDRCLLKQLVQKNSTLELSDYADSLLDDSEHMADVLSRLEQMNWLKWVDETHFEWQQPLLVEVIRYLMVHSMSLGES